MDVNDSRKNPFGDNTSPFERDHVKGAFALDPMAGRPWYLAPVPPKTWRCLEDLRYLLQTADKERIEVPLGQKAMALDAIDEYYWRILGHQRQTGTSVSDRGHLHFTAYSVPVHISSAERQKPSPDLKGKERADAFYDIDIPGHKATFWDQEYPLSVVKGWRKQQPDDLVVEFIIVYAGGHRRLVPIEWETVRACEHCDMQHQVARRIGEVSVIEKIPDREKDLPSPFIEKFVILG
jgi:hypothetical protein